MQTIEFVLRSRMGSFQEGSLTGESGNTTIFLQTGDQVSLHLARHQVAGYEREGSNLIVKLADGREIVLSDYFSGDAGDQPRVFLSSNGEIVEVDLISAGENEYFAQYSSSEVWGKWSPNEELVFLEETDPLAVASAPQEYEDETVSMLGAGAILGPGLGLGGAAVAGLAGASILTGGSGGGTGGGSGGGETDKAPATVNDPDTAVTIGGDGTTEEDETVTITGTGEPGASVSVEVNGKTETGTVDPDGNWTVTFEKETYPGEGNHEVDVTVTDPDGEVTELKGPDVVIDTTPPDLDFSSGVVETNDAHNETEHSSGVTLTGVGEAGSSLVVTIDGTSHSTTVDENGNWSVTFDKSELATGEYTTSATFVTTDGFGNSATYTADVEIDTQIDAAIDRNLSGGDDIVSAAEHTAAVAISGTADPNAAISLSINGNTYTTTTDANGNWTVDVPTGKLPTGEVDVPMTVTATDPAGNETTANGTLHVDTVGSVDISEELVENDGVVSKAEMDDGLVPITGTSEAGTTSVLVTIAGETYSATVAANGDWTVNVPSAKLPTGETTVGITAVATDAVGNTSTSSGTIDIDTFVNKLTVTDDSTGNDNVVNAAELEDGLVLSGEVELGAQSVIVTFNGVNYTATVDENGNWTATIPAANVPDGTHTYTVTAVDKVGNTASTTHSIDVDTTAPEGPVVFEHTSREDGGTGDHFIRQIVLKDDGEELEVYTIADDGTVSNPVQADTYVSASSAMGTVSGYDEVEIQIANSERVWEGTTLLVQAEDDAGNTSGTLMVIDKNGSPTLHVDHAIASGMNVETIDLTQADVDLTITEAQIRALSENSDQITVRGGADDQVTITGAVKTGTQTDGMGQSFDVYSLGDDGAVILVDDEITNVII